MIGTWRSAIPLTVRRNAARLQSLFALCAESEGVDVSALLAHVNGEAMTREDQETAELIEEDFGEVLMQKIGQEDVSYLIYKSIDFG